MGCGRKHLFVLTFFGYFFVSRQKSAKSTIETKHEQLKIELRNHAHFVFRSQCNLSCTLDANQKFIKKARSEEAGF